MHIRSVALLSLLSVLQVLAELKWKCELIDTSGEVTPQTKFVEYVSGKPPTPNVPRVPRSAPKKCRPRPKNGGGAVSTETKSMKIERVKSVVQGDAPNGAPPKNSDAPSVKYTRKESRQSTDLNIGPGFEESQDPYGRSRDPVPRRFRPTHLKGADELDKPLAEHLDENVMPDFELDDDATPPIEEDLPWCEEPDCESSDLETLSLEELTELQDRCEHSVSPDRLKQIKERIRVEKGNSESPDKTDLSPPTSSPNCSTDPADLKSAESIEKYRRMCPCESDISKMSPEQLEVFKKECLDPLLIPGSLIRKSGRCLKSQKETDRMDETRYAKFVRECVVQPKIVLKKELKIIKSSPECVKREGMTRREFEVFRKNCVSGKSCEEIDEEKLEGKQLAQYNAQCNPNPNTRKTMDLCETSNTDSLSDEQFEDYKLQCIFEPIEYCSSTNPDELGVEEYEKYKEKCQKRPEGPPPVDSRGYCENVRIEDFNSEEYQKYLEKCTPKKRVSCEDEDLSLLKRYNDRKFKKMLFECTTLQNCEKVKSSELSEQRAREWDRECSKNREFCESTEKDRLDEQQIEQFRRKCLKFDCDAVDVKNLSKRELERYQEKCGATDCTSLNPKTMSSSEYQNFERKCLKSTENCQNVKVKELNEQEYLRFQKECLRVSEPRRNPRNPNCDNIDTNRLTKEEYQKYLEDCGSAQPDCDSVEPKKLNKSELRKFQKKCISLSEDCQDVNVQDLSPREYQDYKKRCLKIQDCSKLVPTELSKSEYKKYLRDCLNSPANVKFCRSVNPKSLDEQEYRDFEKRCLSRAPDCRNVKVAELSEQEYVKFEKECLTRPDCVDVDTDRMTKNEYLKHVEDCPNGSEPDCSSVNPKNLNEQEYRDFERDCLRKKENCQNVKVKELNEQEYEKFQKECLKEQHPEPECSEIEPKKLSRKQFVRFQKECISDTDYCRNVDVYELNRGDYEEYKKKCMEHSTRKKFDCENVNPDELGEQEYRAYEKSCLPNRPSDCDTIRTDEMSSSELAEHQKRCGRRRGPPRKPGDSVDITKKVIDGGPNRPESVTLIKKVVVNKGGNPNVDVRGNKDECDEVDVNGLSDREYKRYLKRCRVTFNGEHCEEVDVHLLSSEKVREYVEKCGLYCGVERKMLSETQKTAYHEKCEKGERELEKDCKNIDLKEIGEKLYAEYAEKCATSTEACFLLKTRKMSRKSYSNLLLKCNKHIRPAPEDSCDNINTDVLTLQEYQDYKKRCGHHEKPKKRCKNGECDSEVHDQDCSVNPDHLNPVEYQKYIRNCGPRSDTYCSKVDVSQLSKTDFEGYKKKCPPPESPSREHVEPGTTPRNCSDVKVETLTDAEYRKYKRECSESSRRGCENVKVEELSAEEFAAHKKRCGPSTSRKTLCADEDVSKMSPEEYEEYKKRCLSSEHPDCSDVNLAKLSDEEYEEYRKKCRPPGRKTNGKDDCSNANIEQMSAEEYAEHKKRCGSSHPDDNCSNVRVEELSAQEYAEHKKRCESPEHPDEKDKNCNIRDLSSLSEKEYQRYRRRCAGVADRECRGKSCSRSPSTTIIKKVVVVPGASEECTNQDTTSMSPEEFEEFTRKCGEFRKTFQFNCNSDVSKMSDAEFRKFRKACGTRPSWKCSDSPSSIPKEDYEKYMEMCDTKQWSNYDCRHAKVERMDAREYAEYKKKCATRKTETESDCDNIKVEELSPAEYEEHKKRCPPPSTPPKRRRINCSIVDTSQLHDSDLLDFKKHCSVHVQTDRYRPEDKIILTKKVVIHTGNESFSCYDQDVDRMSEEEYARFEKKCLKIHFRYVCGSEDTTRMSKVEYADYQRECSSSPSAPPESVKLEQTLIINKNGSGVADGCYDKDVNAMSDEEYAEYEVRCLGREKKVRKVTMDCHNVDLSKLSYDELEQHLKRCRAREQASTPRPRQSLQCSDVDTEKLDDAAYQKWVRECQTAPKNITLKRILEIKNPDAPPMSGGESVTVQKVQIFGKARPGDDNGSLEGSEDFGVRVKTLTMKKIEGGGPDDVESENGLILVKKVVHQIPRRRRPQGSDEAEDEGGVIEVKKLIMKTASEPDVDDSQDTEEIIRRAPKKVGPREEVVLLSVSKRHGHPYKVKRTEEEEPTEEVTLKKNTKHPGKVLREVRIKKHFGQGLREETVVQEIGGPDFKITRKKIMIPHRVRKLKSTTTTTTTPAEPEYYYDEEEVPEYITLVKVEKSSRPLRKHTRPQDEDEEFVDVREDEPKSYVEFEGYVKVRGAPRKLGKRPRYTDSGEEPEIREVTRKVVEQPGGEDDDLKAVRLRSHVKILKVTKRREVPEEDGEHQVTMVKKLKVLKLGEQEKERFEEEEGDDGQVVVKNRRRKYERERVRPEDELAEEVEGRVAVRGRAPKRFQMHRKVPIVTEENSQFRRIGGHQEEESQRFGKSRRRRFEEEEELERERLRMLRKTQKKELSSAEQGESVTLVKKQVITKKRAPQDQDEDENEEIRLRNQRRKALSLERARSEQSGEQEEVKILKKKSMKFERKGALHDVEQDGEDQEEFKLKKKKMGVSKKIHEASSEEQLKLKTRKTLSGVKIRGGRKSFYGSGEDQDQDQDEEDDQKETMKRTVYRIGKDGKRQVVRKSESDLDGSEGEEGGVTITKGKKTRRFYKIGPNGERQLVRSETGDGGGVRKDHGSSSGSQMSMFGAKKSSWSNQEEGEGVTIRKSQSNHRVYRIGANGEKELVKEDHRDGGVQKEMFGDQGSRKTMSGAHESQTSMFGAKKSSWSSQPLGTDQAGEGEGVTIRKSQSNHRVYRIGANGEKELVKNEHRDGGVQKEMFGDGGSGSQMKMFGAKKSSWSSEPLGTENQEMNEEHRGAQKLADPQGGSVEVDDDEAKRGDFQDSGRKRQPKVGSVRGEETSEKRNAMSHGRLKKMRRYSRDERLRSGGKSEESIPDAH